MTIFENDYKSYLNSESGKYYLQYENINLNKPTDFVKMAILSIFDGKNGWQSNGIISDYEILFSKTNYEARVEELKKYYYTQTGKELDCYIPTKEDILAHAQDAKISQPWLNSNFRGARGYEIEQIIKPDGVITSTRQGGTGNCYLDAALMSLSDEDIKNAKRETDTGYEIVFRGLPGIPKYTITHEELVEAQNTYLPNGRKKYSSADADVVLFALAIEKHRSAIKHNSNNKNDKADLLAGGCGADVMSWITGRNPYYGVYTLEVSDENDLQKYKKYMTVGTWKVSNNGGKTYYIHPEKEKQVMERLNELANGEYCSCCSFSCVDGAWKNFEKYGLREEHVYSLQRIDLNENCVYVADPHDGKYNLKKITLSEFTKYVNLIDSVSKGNSTWIG